MILEVAILDVIQGQESYFERDFTIAQQFICQTSGYIEHELQKCIENESRYILLVRWQTLENHTQDFRQSKQYQEWKKLLHHYYHPFPEVEHYTKVTLD